MRFIHLAPALTLVFTAACGNAVSSNIRRSSSHAMLSSNVLTLKELNTVTSAGNMYDVVVSLNPDLLRHRGRVVSVAIDGVLTGTVETLRYLAPGTVHEIRLIEGPDATMLFGSRHTGSVLMVTTRRR